MSSYRLTATLGGARRSRTFTASDDTLDATITAISIILDLAADDPEGPWAVGLVRLLNQHGTVLHEMPAK